MNAVYKGSFYIHFLKITLSVKMLITTRIPLILNLYTVLGAALIFLTKHVWEGL